MTRETKVFAEMVPVLAWLAEQGIPWGIVTNKATRFASPLVKSLGLAEQVATLICGGTRSRTPSRTRRRCSRPRVGSRSTRPDCVYVGDDRRDVDAGRAAAMQTIVAAWGYLGAGDAPAAWGADHLIERPGELPRVIGVGRSLTDQGN
jgi:phosphoglycolate phosphatase